MPKKKPGKDASGISRRDFFKSSTAVGAASTALISGQAAGQNAGQVEVFGPDTVDMKLRVDGKTYRLQAEPRVTLLDALRNYLDLTGSKKVCDRASCGACTVLLDDQPVYACTVLAIEAQGKQITTVAGLGTPDDLHPVQEAFVRHDAQQCGFCTPGFVVATTAFLKKHPNPSEEDIKKGLGGNYCRCGTYVGIREVVQEIAEKGGIDA